MRGADGATAFAEGALGIGSFTSAVSVLVTLFGLFFSPRGGSLEPPSVQPMVIDCNRWFDPGCVKLASTGLMVFIAASA